jgi:hypothetical protein
VRSNGVFFKIASLNDLMPSLRGALATKQSILFFLLRQWIASLRSQ